MKMEWYSPTGELLATPEVGPWGPGTNSTWTMTYAEQQNLLYFGNYKIKYYVQKDSAPYQLAAQTEFSVVDTTTWNFSACRKKDSLSLVSLYNSTGGANWTYKWNLSLTINNWIGVKGINNSTGCVSNLDLSYQNLKGSLPQLPGFLDSLTELNLSYNVLEGSFPPSLSTLSQLTSLDLSNNKLTGTLPQSIGNLNNLGTLKLGYNKLEGQIPASLGASSRLIFLDLSNNIFSGVLPQSFVNNSGLINLNLSNNHLDSLPDLSKLRLISVYDPDSRFCLLTNSVEKNNLTFDDLLPIIKQSGFDDSCFNYGNQYPFFTDTLIIATKDSDVFVDLKIDAGIDSNVYTWSLPTNSLKNENKLRIRKIQLSQSGAYKCQVTNPHLPKLTLQSRTITIVVTPTLAARDSLALVALYDSTTGQQWTHPWILSQPMSTWYGVTLNNSGSVRKLDLARNGLRGKIPYEIGSLLDLDTLCFQHNPIFDTIPSQIGNLKKLKVLDLSYCFLEGNIPEQLSYLTNLKILNLGSILNTFDIPHLSGTIPSGLGNLSNLELLDLSGNYLIGNIPETLGKLTQLKKLDLSGYSFNRNGGLSGKIPIEIGNLINLDSLMLTRNSLTDTIPSQLGNLKNLKYLDISHNTFKGALPETFRNLKSLKNLLCSFNQIDSLPDLSSVFKDSISIFDVTRNKLTFDDILPNTLNHTHFSYDGQDSIFRDTLISMVEHDNTAIDLGIDKSVTTSKYRWYRNNILIDSIVSSKWVFKDVNLNQTGTYYCEITNANAPNLILHSHNFRIKVWKLDQGCRENQDVSICKGDLYTLPKGKSTGIEGIYKDTLFATNGCDTVIVTNLTFHKPIKAVADYFEINTTQTSIELPVIQNDSVEDKTLLSVNILQDVKKGTLKKSNDLSFMYIPPFLRGGYDTFRYQVCNKNCQKICDTATVIINIIRDEADDFQQTAITPNGDGINDVLFFDEIDKNPNQYPNAELVIYNRGGSVLFRESAYKNDWQGTNQTGEQLPTGTYFFILNLKDISNKVFKGNITVLRK